MLRFLRKNEIASNVESLTLVFAITEGQRHFSIKQLPPGRADSLFRSLFETINPFRLTILAPPEILSALTSCSLDRPFFDHYHMPFQILSLTHPRSSHSAHIAEPNATLFSIRPWSGILLNEGSFLRAYSVCGFPFTGNIPPSILPDLVSVNRKTRACVLPSDIRDFSYIAIFPFSFHFVLLEKLLISSAKTLYPTHSTRRHRTRPRSDDTGSDIGSGISQRQLLRKCDPVGTEAGKCQVI